MIRVRERRPEQDPGAGQDPEGEETGPSKPGLEEEQERSKGNGPRDRAWGGVLTSYFIFNK